ncbi:NotI family restriction endonuclease [Aureimonas glaciei]|uniref:Restriction endonuclease type II NotI domain-containing protein n=1 Tax=Aureimonas glaciei TaxID=1776957 RepID=A0A916XU55_9HYPH|nr:NotI family restriction endonuclease [Aureimonas glaciei]GGD11961.1 hypothetical protein GCM10011335_13620 [Aureimonas glaciei]
MSKTVPREAQPFPIIEAFGFPVGSSTPEALRSQTEHLCPFAENTCEKYRQYGFGYCSVTYAAADDAGRRHTYAVCDHRVDGTPLLQAVAHHFGNKVVELVPEVVLTDPRTSFDYVAFTRSPEGIDDAIAIETQAVDIRGGGVGPAWRAWQDGRQDEWRAYFTEEASTKNRRDTVAYGVNMANIYKRLGLQVATKGTYLKAIGVKLYVVMQDRPFRYLKNRVKFVPVEPDDNPDIVFMTFDYSGSVDADGRLNFGHVQTVCTTLENYTVALSSDHRATADQRAGFLEKVASKASRTVAVSA